VCNFYRADCVIRWISVFDGGKGGRNMMRMRWTQGEVPCSTAGKAAGT
jgi:hypothetical protein